MPDHESYNKFSGFSNLPYNIISHLILNDEIIWKLLYYPENDALVQSNLTKVQKRTLIYKGQDDATPFRVFTTQFMDDSFQERQTQLRVYSGLVVPENYVQGVIDYRIDVMCHNKISILDTTENRLDVMFEHIMNALNGRDIESLGKLYFNADRRRTNSSALFNPNDYYIGRGIIMSTNYAG
jgi:translation elongation factor EF-G